MKEDYLGKYSKEFFKTTEGMYLIIGAIIGFFLGIFPVFLFLLVAAIIIYYLILYRTRKNARA